MAQSLLANTLSLRRCAPAAALAFAFGSATAGAQIIERRATPAPAAASQFILGERPFSSSSSWNTPIAADAAYTRILWPRPNGYNYSVSWESYSPSIHCASPSDPIVAVAYPPGWGYPGGILHLRMPREADGATGTDGELLVIDGKLVHNFWQFKRHGDTAAVAKAYGAADALTGSGWGTQSPFSGAGITAAGSSQLAGLLIQAETDRGEIGHALQMSIESSLAKPGKSGEAINADGRNSSGIAREGDRLAIPPQTPMPDGLSPLGEKVFRASQKFGVFVIDVAGGVTNLRAQANAYDAAVITLLRRDVSRITPLLQHVQ